jgi:hypothetical protein
LEGYDVSTHSSAGTTGMLGCVMVREAEPLWRWDRWHISLLDFSANLKLLLKIEFID